MIYVFIADGFEETEAIAPIDILRRCKKEVLTVGIGGKERLSSHKIKITCDISEDEVKLDDDLEMVILPGGMPGTLNLEKSDTVQKALDFCNEKGLFIGAICAAPSVLGHKGLLQGRKAVCYSGYEKELIGAEVLYEPAVTDGNIITSRGAGTAVQFGLKLAEALISSEKAAEIADSIMC